MNLCNDNCTLINEYQYEVELPIEFVCSANDKTITTISTRFYNADGQVDLGNIFHSDLNSSNDYPSQDGFVMFANSDNVKQFEIKDNKRKIKIWFTDYKNTTIQTSENYYFLIQLELHF